MATWFVNSTATGTGAGTSWTNAFVSLAAAISHPMAAGDTCFVGDNHAESTAANTTLTFPGTLANPIYIICADHTVTTPGASNWKTTGSVAVTGSGNVLTIDGNGLYVYGLNFVMSPLAVNAGLAISAGTSINTFHYYDSCTFTNNSTNVNATGISIGASSGTGSVTKCIWNNTTISTNRSGGSGTQINLYVGTLFQWHNTASALLGTLGSTCFSSTSSGSTIYLEGVDLSAMGSGKTLVGPLSSTAAYILNCKLGSAVTIAATPTAPGSLGVMLVNSDSTGTNNRFERYLYEGTQTTSTSIVRTSGASDGATPVSWQLLTTANSTFVNPFITMPIDQWNTATGSSENAFIRGIWNSASLPTNAQIWMEAQYLGSSATPVSSFINTAAANLMTTGSPLTADTSAWDSHITAWIATHAYTLGQTMTLGNGQVYFCTTAGTTAGSAPTAVADGSSTATDGSVVWRAGMRFQMSVSFTPALIGSVFVIAKMAVASSTMWIDPLITSV